MVQATTLQDNAPMPGAGRRPRLTQRLRRRYLDVLASIYIYNEHRGYRSLDRVLEAVRARCPDDAFFIAQIEKHRADEARHYAMFRRYFELRGAMPFAVDRTCGHIDRLIKLSFGCHIDDLDTAEVVADEAMFARLCRVIMLTEMRGMHMVDDLLQSAAIRADRPLHAIFKAVERDEPSHWMPYDAWLKEHGGDAPTWAERIADSWVHLSLMLVKLPLLYCNIWLKRRTDWQHDADEAVAVPSAEPLAEAQAA